jgi:hypothetical protein
MFHPWEIAAQTPALARSYSLRPYAESGFLISLFEALTVVASQIRSLSRAVM